VIHQETKIQSRSLLSEKIMNSHESNTSSQLFCEKSLAKNKVEAVSHLTLSC